MASEGHSTMLHVVGAALLAALLSACATDAGDPLENPLDNFFGDSAQAPSADTYAKRPASHLRRQEIPVPPQAMEVHGSGRFVGRSHYREEPAADGRDGISLSFVNAPVAEVAKTVLGDILGLNYAIAPDVKGTITLHTAAPVHKDALGKIFENVLQASGYALSRKNGVYIITQAKDAAGPVGVAGRRGPSLGHRIVIVPLQYVRPSKMARLLEPVGGKKAVAATDDARGVIILAGTATDVANMREMIRALDVDALSGMSVGLYPVRSQSPVALAKQLERMFLQGRDGGLMNGVRIVPNQKLGAVLVIARNRRLLRQARQWLARLDSFARENEERVFVYRVENRDPKELAKLLDGILNGGQATQDEPPKPVGPRFTAGAADNAGTGGGKDKGDATAPDMGGADVGSGDGSSGGSSRIAIVPDMANKALLIRTTPIRYEKILNILYKLDVPPTQVMLEAVIAEVALTDELRFGVKWFLQQNKHKFIFSDLVSGDVAPIFPGFSYIFEGVNTRLVLDALSEITDVNIISAPSIMVMDNKEAILQIGDQVPIATQVARDTGDAKAPVITKIEMKDTGVIFRVKPQVNENGQIRLAIDQEISSARKTTTSGIDSPTISRRKISTNVVVNDGSVVALGGLIQQRDATGRKQVPILGNIPVLGTAFRTKTSTIARTELIVFLRPRVIRRDEDARAIAHEFRRRLNMRPLLPARPANIHERDATRILK